MIRFGNGYEKNREGEPPNIVAELRAKLLVNETGMRKARGTRAMGFFLRRVCELCFCDFGAAIYVRMNLQAVRLGAVIPDSG